MTSTPGTEEERLPCPRCSERSLAFALQCYACGIDLLVNLEVAQPLTDKRQAYTVAKTICAQFPNLTFSQVQSALTGEQRILLGATTRSVASWVGGELAKQGVETATRWPQAAQPVRQASSSPWRVYGAVIGMLWAVIAIVYANRVELGLASKAATVRPGNSRGMRAPDEDTEPELNEAPEAPAAVAALGAREIAARVVPATVTVVCGDSQGSGFFVRPDLAITNQHVCEDEEQSPKLVLDDGRELVGTVIRRVERLDAVLIQVTGAREKALSLGDSTTLRRGDPVFIIGAPLRMGFTLSQGVVSHPTRRMMGLSYVQLDLSTSPGNSGGPLVDGQGQVVGLVTYKIGEESVMGLALAINHLFTGEAPLLDPPARYDEAAWKAELAASAAQGKKDKAEALAELEQPILVRARADARTVYAAIAYLGEGAVPKRVKFDLARSGGERCLGIGAKVSDWHRLATVGDDLEGLAPSARAWAKENHLETKPRMGVASFSLSACPGDTFRRISLKLQGGMPGSDTVEVSR